MSDPDVPENKSADSVDDVVGSANEGLDAAAAARADVPPADGAADAVDPDLEAFAAAERDHPGTFLTTEHAPADAAEQAPADAGTEPVAATAAVGPADEYVDSTGPVPADSVDNSVHAASVADTAYAAPAVDTAAETQVVPAEPVAPPPAAPQPIFVQAPEPPRELGNRAAAGAIGLLAMVSFAILYLGAILGIGAVEGTVTVENVGTAALAPLSTWSFWVPVVIFYIAFWLLGAIINRGRWGHWVIFGLFVGAAAYGGHILGQLFQAPFWRLTPTEAVELIEQQTFAPLAIAAFLFARELTIWFGAWVARSGARKKELNAEAQAEYERTLEAGPSAAR
ncbi:ABC transporter [Microbacterium esteraromaticum]|uniref:ABC transporter n=1 Tax=Microbacterium esteraromaticum TaxID=57043 RepID=UPI001C969225|nr:ABC transporter [Microbacterium esteraromaticum]MBY6061522.1 ABC transporter [Microbacterium esteraromaticum]